MGNSDNRSPCGTHSTRKNQLIPQIDQKRAIDIGPDVHRTALLQDGAGPGGHGLGGSWWTGVAMVPSPVM
jgi:hypothetical protein